MRRPSPLPEPLSNRPFTTREAGALGVSTDRLRRSDLSVPFRGIRVPTGAVLVQPADTSTGLSDDASEPWLHSRRLAIERARAYQAGISDRLVFSHVTAAHLHGLYLPTRLALDPSVHVATTAASRRPQSRGVSSHLIRDRPLEVVETCGMRAVGPIETWCQLATTMSIDELVVVGDQLVQRQNPMATLEQLRLAVHRGGGRHGIRRLRAALDLVRPRTDSPKETHLRLLLVRGGLPEPTVNAPVLSRTGVHIRLGDLVYTRHRVLVEFDGDQHRTDRRQYERDIRHLEDAANNGWRVIRVTNHQLRTAPAAVVARVRAALLAAGRRP